MFNIVNPYLTNEEILHNMITLINPKENDIVLDVGTGEGNTAFALAKNPKVQKVIAIDQDENALERFKNKLDEKLIQDDIISKINIKKCSYEDIANKFNRNKFNIISCRAALHHFLNPNNFLNAAYSLLEDNGKLCIMDPFFSEKTRDIWMSISKLKENDLKGFYTFEEYTTMLEDSGFQIVSSLIFRFPRDFNNWIKSLPMPTENIINRFKEVMLEINPVVKKELQIKQDNTGNIKWSYNCFEILAIKMSEAEQFVKLNGLDFQKTIRPNMM